MTRFSQARFLRDRQRLQQKNIVKGAEATEAALPAARRPPGPRDQAAGYSTYGYVPELRRADAGAAAAGAAYVPYVPYVPPGQRPTTSSSPFPPSPSSPASPSSPTTATASGTGVSSARPAPAVGIAEDDFSEQVPLLLLNRSILRSLLLLNGSLLLLNGSLFEIAEDDFSEQARFLRAMHS